MGRLELQTLLKTLAPNAYFQPPPNLRMSYPCIVYQVDAEDTNFADNKPYNSTQRYQVTIIDENPDSDIRPKVAALPMCIFNRFFIKENLNHYVYNLYF